MKRLALLLVIVTAILAASWVGGWTWDDSASAATSVAASAATSVVAD